MKVNKDKKLRIKRKVFYRTPKNREKYSIKVYKSNLYTYAIVLDSDKKVLTSFVTKKVTKKASKTDLAKEVGKLAGQYLIKKKVKEVYFDRNGYRYHGRVKAVAEGAREVGLNF